MKESGELSLAKFTLFAVLVPPPAVSPSSEESALSKVFHPTATRALESTVSNASKLAVIVVEESTVTVKGLSDPETSPDHPLNSYPSLGVAVIVTTEPDV